jgi:UDP-2,3-diacylglucosamine pyrophosphatase LpxH
VLVVLSDLHFQDIESQKDLAPSDQNVHHTAFVDFLQWIAEEYLDKCRPGTELKLVLNGDIIDFLRTERWFQPEERHTRVRPYEDHHEKGITWEDSSTFTELDTRADDVLLEIFDEVTGRRYGADYKDAPNIETIKALSALRRFRREVGEKGRRLEDIEPYPSEGDEDVKKLSEWEGRLRRHGASVQYLFLPGNHDRLVNVSSRLNAALREFFLIKNSQGTFSAERFRWDLHEGDYKVFLRHGHIYDWTNNEENLVFQRRDAKKVNYSFQWRNGYNDSKLYYNTPIGDLITTDLVAYMPHLFVQKHRETREDTLLEICRRLRELDDVRPLPAVLPWLYDLTKKPDGTHDEALWKEIAGVVDTALDNTFFAGPQTAQREFFQRWNSTHDRLFFDKSDIFGNGMAWARRLLKAPSKLFQKTYAFMEKYMVGSEDNPVPGLIKKYKHPFMGSAQDYYVAGHVHSSSTHFLQKEKVYHCTGTWRTMHSRCLYTPEFKKMKSMNFIYFFRSEERREPGGRVYIWRGLLGEK